MVKLKGKIWGGIDFGRGIGWVKWIVKLLLFSEFLLTNNN
jgi:hypothetical protein